MKAKTKPNQKLSTRAFIQQCLARGKLTDAQILAAARRRAPKQKIADTYVSWYRWDAKRRSV